MVICKETWGNLIHCSLRYIDFAHCRIASSALVKNLSSTTRQPLTASPIRSAALQPDRLRRCEPKSPASGIAGGASFLGGNAQAGSPPRRTVLLVGGRAQTFT